MIRIVLDCFGGDHSPSANVKGAIAALNEFPDLFLILTGDEEKIKQELTSETYDKNRVEIVHAPSVITCDDIPTDAIRQKRDSSMMTAVRILREDDTVSGLVSTGSTGALVAASLLRIGRIPGVIRPAFCPILPTMNGGIVGVCDSGANVDITPEHLRQFALMGSSYLEAVCHIDNPRIALLNIGEEKEKGDNLRKEAYHLLDEEKQIHFIGNIEGRDLLSGKVDLVVCDGFSGNVLLKATEGTSLSLLKRLKQDVNASLLNRIGGLLLYRTLMKEKEFMNYQNYGGSVLLGTSKTVIKGHGSSKASAVTKCIEQAYLTKTSSLNEIIDCKINKTREENHVG